MLPQVLFTEEETIIQTLGMCTVYMLFSQNILVLREGKTKVCFLVSLTQSLNTALLTRDWRAGGSPHTTQFCSRHQLWILQFNSILTPSTWRQPQTPQVRLQSHKIVPHIKRQSPALGVTKASDLPAISQASHKPLLGLDLLEHLTELREAFYLYLLMLL